MAGLTYAVFDAVTGAARGSLTSVGPEPVIGGVINQGGKAITITMPTWPVGILNYFDVVQVTDPHGVVLGKWRFFDWQGDERERLLNTIQFWPLAEELDAPFTGNYTDYDSASPVASPILNSGLFSRPVNAAVATTKHCTTRTINNDGNSYQSEFVGAPYGASTIRDTLLDAVSAGGSAWWWYCDNLGKVDLMGAARNTFTFDIPAAAHTFSANSGLIISRKRHDDVTQLFNRQPATGIYAYDPIDGTPIVASVDGSTGTYTAANIGLRCAKTLNIPSARTKTQLAHLAAVELVRDMTPGETWTVIMSPGSQRVTPGDKVIMQDWRAPEFPFIHDPMWVTSVEEHNIGALGNLGYTSGYQTVTLDAA